MNVVHAPVNGVHDGLNDRVTVDSAGRPWTILEPLTVTAYVMNPYTDSIPVPAGYWADTARLRRTLRRADADRKNAAA